MRLLTSVTLTSDPYPLELKIGTPVTPARGTFAQIYSVVQLLFVFDLGAHTRQINGRTDNETHNAA